MSAGLVIALAIVIAAWLICAAIVIALCNAAARGEAYRYERDDDWGGIGYRSAPPPTPGREYVARRTRATDG